MIRFTTELERKYLKAMGVRFRWLVFIAKKEVDAVILHTTIQHRHHESDEEIYARALARAVSLRARVKLAVNWQLWLAVLVLALLIFATRAHGQLGPTGQGVLVQSNGGGTQWVRILNFRNNMTLACANGVCTIDGAAGGPGGGTTWGSITGTLSSQTDLNTALGGKSNTGHTHVTGDITNFPTLATVATSGLYSDLSGKPTLAATKTAVAGSPLLSYDSTTGAFTQGALTASQVGAVPTTRTVAGKALSADITIACADLSNDGSLCASNGPLPVTKTAVAGSPLLSYDSTTGAFTQGALTAANVGALASSTVLPATKTCTGTDKVSAYDSSTGLYTCTADQGGAGGGMADPGGNGVVVRTALNTTSVVTITGTSNSISVTHGDGTAGNPTIDLSPTIDISSGHTLIQPVGTSAMTATEGNSRWNSTWKMEEVYDTQRQRAVSSVGWLPSAYAANGNVTLNTAAQTATLAANGGTLASYVVVQSQMLLQEVQVQNQDTTLARTWNWYLYVQDLNNGNAGENTLRLVANGAAAETFTATVGSRRIIAAASAPVYLPPGIYWIVIQNQHASNTFGLGYATAAGVGQGGNSSQTKTLSVPLGSTLDFVAATWTKNTFTPGIRLNGRIFGQTAAF